MGGFDHLHHLVRDGTRILLLDQLRKHFLKTRQMHQFRQIGGGRIGQHPPFGNYDDAVADLLNHLKHMRNVENGLAACSQQFKKVFK